MDAEIDFGELELRQLAYLLHGGREMERYQRAAMEAMAKNGAILIRYDESKGFDFTVVQTIQGRNPDTVIVDEYMFMSPNQPPVIIDSLTEMYGHLTKQVVEKKIVFRQKGYDPKRPAWAERNQAPRSFKKRS